jgi:hypothetical protein
MPFLAAKGFFSLKLALNLSKTQQERAGKNFPALSLSHLTCAL